MYSANNHVFLFAKEPCYVKYSLNWSCEIDSSLAQI